MSLSTITDRANSVRVDFGSDRALTIPKTGTYVEFKKDIYIEVLMSSGAHFKVENGTQTGFQDPNKVEGEAFSTLDDMYNYLDSLIA